MRKRLAPTVALLLVMMLLLAAACGGASSRTKILRVNLVALNTARDAVLALSKEREKQIYDTCIAEAAQTPPACTKEQGHARVEAWQKKVDEAIRTLDIGYRSIHDAALLNDAKSESDARAAFARALVLVEDLQKLKETP